MAISVRERTGELARSQGHRFHRPLGTRLRSRRIAPHCVWSAGLIGLRSGSMFAVPLSGDRAERFCCRTSDSFLHHAGRCGLGFGACSSALASGIASRALARCALRCRRCLSGGSEHGYSGCLQLPQRRERGGRQRSSPLSELQAPSACLLPCFRSHADSKRLLCASGSADNAFVMRAGATSEMMGGVTLDAVKIIQDAPGVAHDANGPLITPEVVAIAPFPLLRPAPMPTCRSAAFRANVLDHPHERQDHRRAHVPHRALPSWSWASNASQYLQRVHSRQHGSDSVADNWTVVGVFDAGGCVLRFRSLVRRARASMMFTSGPTNIFQSITVHLDFARRRFSSSRIPSPPIRA